VSSLRVNSRFQTATIVRVSTLLTVVTRNVASIINYESETRMQCPSNKVTTRRSVQDIKLASSSSFQWTL